MKTILVPLSFGALWRNNGTELAPELLAKSLKTGQKGIKICASNIEKSHESIRKTAFSCLKGNCLFLGGDHSLTYSTFRAFSRRFGEKNAALVLFDAHADCTFFTSAKSHEDYLRALVLEKALLPQNVLLVGTRHVWKEEHAFLKAKKIMVLEARAIKRYFEKAKKAVKDFVRAKKAVYVSIDFDVLDSRIAFATGYPEPNGLNEKQLFGLLKAALQKNVHAIDFVEFNPLLDRNKKGLALARRILKFLLSLF